MHFIEHNNNVNCSASHGKISPDLTTCLPSSQRTDSATMSHIKQTPLKIPSQTLLAGFLRAGSAAVIKAVYSAQQIIIRSPLFGGINFGDLSQNINRLQGSVEY